MLTQYNIASKHQYSSICKLAVNYIILVFIFLVYVMLLFNDDFIFKIEF